MVLVLGEIVVDVTLSKDLTKLRLGGIFHACRALWAAGVDYQLAYIAPDYLDRQVQIMSKNIGASNCLKLGSVTGSPNVILIQNAQETSHQGYELLLREEYECEYAHNSLTQLSSTEIDDILVFPGQYDLTKLFAALSDSTARVHIDWANTNSPLECIGSLGRSVDTLFTSTSSDLFLSQCEKDTSVLRDHVLSFDVNSILLKENRGGAYFVTKTGNEFEVGAQIREVKHSVGVGDCFDAIFVALAPSHGARIALSYAAWLAAEYAVTSFPDDFARAARSCLAISAEEITEIPGIRLRWDARESIHIYIAAPDFDYADTRAVDEVADCLKYHNFRPHRPVQEHGQATHDMTVPERKSLCFQDIELIKSCQAVVAIIEQDDPGTSVEIGLAAGLDIPVFLYDPLRRAENPMLLGTPSAICHSVDSLLLNLFTYFGSRVSVK